MAIQTGGEDELLSEINVTPLVDVMLVLLIVFMVTAPMLVAGIQVELPTGGVAQESPAREVLTLAVDRDGIVYLESDPVHPSLLQERLEGLAAEQPLALRVKADASVPYGTVMQVLDAVNRAGIADVGLVTRPAGNDDEASGDRTRRRR